MKRTREDEPSKTRRGWPRGRGRSPQNGDDRPAPATQRRSSRSVFGPSGEDRPDVLTDAETVVLPIWLHRRLSSADGKTGASAASFLKTITVPNQEDEATGPAPGAGAAPKTGAAPQTKAAPQTEAAPETSEPPETAGTAAAPQAGTEPISDDRDVGAQAGDPGLGDPADADQREAEPAEAEPAEAEPEDASPGEAAEAKVAEADAVTLVQAGTPAATEADASADTVVEADGADATDADTVIGANPATAAKAGADADADAGASATTATAADPDATTVVATVQRAGTTAAPVPAESTEAEPTTAEPPATKPPAAESPEGGATGTRIAGQDALGLPGGTRPDAEVTTILSRTELKTAMIQARTLEAIEAIEAIDALEISTLGGLEARTAKALNTVEAISALEARTAQAIKTIEAMTADAFEAIDATVAEVASELTSKLVPPGQADQADEADADEADRGQAASPYAAGDAESSPGTDVAPTRVIRIDEPPESITLSTSSTETTIAVPRPRAESTVAVTPTPAAHADTKSSLAQPVRTPEPAVLPASPPGPQAEPGPQAGPGPQAEPDTEPPYTTTQRRTRVSRFLLLCLLGFQALMSLRLHNTAYFDEAQYLYSGHLELEHLLHGTPLQGSFTSVYSGSPVLYPVLAAAVDQLGGLTAARLLSLAEMLSVTALLYSLTRRLFNERIALCAALLFCVTEPVIFLGNFATYDATSLFLLALAAWIMVRTAAFRWPVFMLAAPVAALAVGVKYAGLLFVPTIAVLPPLASWPLRGRRVLLYPLGFVAAVGGLLYGGLRLGGHAYVAAIASTTTNRAHGATPVMTLLRETAEWGGVIFVLALIGTAAYVWGARTEPEVIAPAGTRFRRLCLGVVLTGTALLAPAYQAHLHTDISFQKHVGFGLFFAAPIAGLGLARLLGDHFRRPHIAVGVWCVALVLGLVQANQLYQSWPNSTQLVQTFSRYLTPHGRYLAEEPSVPIYYLLGHQDARPSQFSSTFYISYRTSKGVRLTGTKGYTAAIEAGHFDIVAYYGGTTPAIDAALGRALADNHAYYLAAQINVSNPFAPGEYFVWVKGHLAQPGGDFVHASSKFQDIGTKTQELAP